jgi:tetratricopeptide (TPR) repeat protein
VEWIANWQIKLFEGSYLLYNVGSYLDDRAEYREAQQYLEQDLAITRAVLGEHHPDTAQSFNTLAVVYRTQGKYSEAETAFLQALAIRRVVLSVQHPDTASSLYNLALLYQEQGKHQQSLPLFEQALAIWQRILGPEYPHAKEMQQAYEEALQALK